VENAGMPYVIATVLTLLNLVWLALTVIGVPGTWLIVLTTALVAWWQWDGALPWHGQYIGGPALITLLVLALLGELIELVAGLLGSKAAGGSRYGATGALIGTFVGGIVGTFWIPVPVIGSLIGACGGAMLGALAFELRSGRKWDESVKSGAGAGVGRLAGTLGKVACGVVMWLLAAVAAFWP
jgi:uncharacterized protein YqgC (DUF456 family)